MDCVENSSKQASHKKHCFVMMADKLKSLRYALKHWQMSISKLKILIQHCNKAISILDSLEARDLYL
jgi:hypothetical protein